MKVPLTKGFHATIDDKDYGLISAYKWCYSHGYAVSYAGGGRKGAKFIRMHRLINNTPDDLITDHINGDKLDNRRSNLRNANKSLNAANSKIRSDNTSGHRGVRWEKDRNKWVAVIYHQNKKIHLGRFDKLADAVRTYNQKAQEIFGDYARAS